MKSMLKVVTFGLSGAFSSTNQYTFLCLKIQGDPDGPGCCAILLALASLLLCLALLPLSLFFCVKVTMIKNDSGSSSFCCSGCERVRESCNIPPGQAEVWWS